MNVIETIQNGNRRVTIFQRASGTYGLLWEYYSDHPDELCWCDEGANTGTACPDLETARREARLRIGLDSN